MYEINNIPLQIRDPINYIGRFKLLEWLSNFLNIDIHSIDETGNGSYACHIFDALYPGTIDMSLVDFSAKAYIDISRNYRILLAGFFKAHVNIPIDISKLSNCKFGDNYEFMLVLKLLCDKKGITSYDANLRRRQSKGLEKLKTFKSNYFDGEETQYYEEPAELEADYEEPVENYEAPAESYEEGAEEYDGLEAINVEN